MAIQKQFEKIKENWLLIALFVFLFLVLFFFMSGGFHLGSQVSSARMDMAYDAGGVFMEHSRGSSSLAPDVIDRVLIKTASMSHTVTEFDIAQDKLNEIIAATSSILVRQNVFTQYDTYRTGTYTVSVPTDKYDEAISQLKQLGDLNFFTEHAHDITGSFIRLRDLLESEKHKLETFERMQENAVSIDEKLRLTDRIFEQQNRIRSLEHQIANQGDRVEFSQIDITLNERRPRHAQVVFATFSDLWSSFKASVNALLYFIAYVFPFLIAYLLLKLIVFWYRKIFN